MGGIVGYMARGEPVPHGTLDSMADELRHSTQHVKESFLNDRMGIARVHLGIFSTEKQPVFNAEKSLGLVSEGAVYADGYDRSNWPEKVLSLFEAKGNAAFAELNGSFSFAIFEPEQGTLRLVTDRFSTRPVYYWHHGDHTAFATESKAILKFPRYKKKLNLVAVSKYLRYGRLCVFGDDTWFEGIMGIPPGSVLTLDKNQVTVEHYWDLVYQPDAATSEDSFAEQLVTTFRNAVKVRTSDPSLRYSVALSGGLDSRVVVASAGKGSNLSAYTFGQPGTRELAIASTVARTLGARHKVCEFDPDSTAQYAEEVVRLSDGLETVGISFLLYCDEIIDGTLDVSLDGFALDLTLGGSFLRRPIMEASNPSLLVSLLDRKFAVFNDAEVRSLLAPEFSARLGDFAKGSFRKMVNQAIGETVPDRADYFALRTRVRNFTIMGHVLSRKYFEDTIPTLDNEFLEVISRIPAGSRYHYRVYRKFLKKLSPEVAGIEYERTGFSPNFPYIFWNLGAAIDKGSRVWNDILNKTTKGRASWNRKNAYVDLSGTLRHSKSWRDLVAKTLVSKDSCMYRFGIVNRDRVLEIVKLHISGKRDMREKILYLITFELVLRVFFSDGI